MSLLTHAALRYAAAGIPVFPVSPNKVPWISCWPFRAELDPGQIRAWWRRWPDANIGLLCSWFWALDVDPRNGGDRTLIELVAAHGPLPITWEQLTGSGGTHYLFRHHRALESVPLGSLKQHPGLDIKGNSKHYVLGAPSRSKAGEYRWIRSPRDCEIADAPGWLLRLIVAAKRVPTPAPVPAVPVDGDARVARARAYARKLDPAIEGQNGSRSTFVAAAKIARGFALSEAEAFAVLAAEWNPHCSPPWTEEDLRRQVARARAISTFPFGGLLEGRHR